ncbi:MAG: transposase [Gammaproteobacteria bacterium]|nr:transposase [Gammaproteobacteria bacterium]MBQ0839983.1 transposase [Gammaproteobacteria bacterium]
MARPLRLEFAGAIYHLTSRGDRREAIYDDDDDRLQWLETLARVCARFNWRVHAYCLMDNHYHLVVETAEGNLSKGMRQLNGVYTQYYNRRHGRAGHVFQGRYKAILVDKEAYLLELSRYVVLNPVRAKMVKRVANWPWSSYPAMVGEQPIAEWLECDWLLSHFGKQRKRTREKYIDFVNEGLVQPSIWGSLQKQIFLGDEAFINKHLKAIKKDVRLDDIPALHKRAAAKPITYYQKKYKNNNEAITQAYLTGAFTMKELGEHFGKHYTTISRIIKANE